MHALTIHAPWSFCIAHDTKRIENRNWPPPTWIIGKQIAIHTGKKVDDEAMLWLREQGLDVPLKSALVLGAVEAVATVLGWVDKMSPSHPQSRWFGGPCGWVLDDVIALPRPVPSRGYQKLWVLPNDVEAEVQAQLMEAA